MAPSEGKTFRLRGIPAGLCKKDVEILVQNTLNCNDVNIRVRSLASDLDNLDEGVATVEISPVPIAFQNTAKGDGWCLDTVYSDEDLSLLFDTNFLGPTPLHTPSHEQWNLDLVAVSGLGGHAFGSFKARGGSFMWLRDALPKDLPGARVIVYGTDTTLQEGNSFQNLSHLGHGLRSTLNEIRAQFADKPLVLLGHSLGGVIIKEAVIQMLRGDNIDQRNRLSIYGILLFGVPNQGMSMESLVPMVGNQPNRFLLETLRAESEVLQEQTRLFLEAFPFPDSEILCCYETRRSATAQQNDQGVWKMEGPATVFVSKDSAKCLRTWETEIQNTLAMNRTHSEMVKFPNKHDRGYASIRKRLKEFALKAAEVIPKRHATVGTTTYPGISPKSLTPEKSEELKNECLKSLSFLEQDSRAHALQPAEGTCDWIFEHEDFCSWLKSSLGLFWIGGKPGSGKSMLMKRVVQRLTRENTETHVVASFFIYGQGVPLQKSRMGLYSALIHQLYQPLSTAFQGLIWDFQNRTDTRGKYGEKWRWTLEDIRSHLFDALKLGSETKSIMIFVDALDEAGEEEARKMIRDFDGLLDGLSESNSKIKVCFSCRHYPDLRLSHAVAVSVEKHNRRDIQTVVDDLLQQLAPEEQTMFKTKIVKNSKGIFHWATLVVDRAVRQRKKGKPFRTVFSTFQEGQADLYQLYEALLSELDEDDRVQAIRLFQWMLFAKRPLTLPELQHAMALSHDMPENSISDYSFGKYFTDANDLEARIMDLSKGLVEVRDPVNISEFLIHPEPTGVHFIHQSVVDYLLDSGIQTLEVVQDTTISSSINFRAHFQLSRSCLRMLFMPEFESFDRDDHDIQDDLDPYSSRETGDRFRYWWDHWIVHILKLENERHPLPRCYRHFLTDPIFDIEKEQHPLPRCYPDYKGPTTQDETEWQDLPDQYEQCDLLDHFSWPNSDKFLQICVRFHNGLSHSESLAELHHTFLRIWNVKNTFHNELATNVWLFALCGSSLIHFLALSGLKAPFQRMINSPRASLEVWDREGRTPLMYAIIGFAFEIAMDLIHAKVDVNTQDIYGNTALHLASFSGEERVVEALLDAGANVNLERMGGATPLHLAVIAQHPLIVAKLLHANADLEKMFLAKHPDRGRRGRLMSTLPGRFPLSNRARATLPGSNSWTTLDIAASNGNVDLARLLIRNGESLGKSLFNAALFGRADMVDFLIQSGSRVENQDSFGRTALILAAANGQREAAVRLIDAKTPLNHADFDGKTALFHAVADGRSIEIARALLKAGADPNRQDNTGRSPIKHAVDHPGLEFTKLLQSFGAVPKDLSAKTKSSEYPARFHIFEEPWGHI